MHLILTNDCTTRVWHCTMYCPSLPHLAGSVSHQILSHLHFIGMFGYSRLDPIEIFPGPEYGLIKSLVMTNLSGKPYLLFCFFCTSKTLSEIIQARLGKNSTGAGFPVIRLMALARSKILFQLHWRDCILLPLFLYRHHRSSPLTISSTYMKSLVATPWFSNCQRHVFKAL
jgi:hypothetical protein